MTRTGVVARAGVVAWGGAQVRCRGHKAHLVSALALMGALAVPHPATAQNFDYGSAELLFGEPVTTSTTGTPLRGSEAPASIDIITAEQIERSGAHSIPEILDRLAGIQVWQGSAQGYDVGFRGYNQGFNPSILVLINGRSVYQDLYGYTAWATLPITLQEIRQIEVVRGPNTALFGFNAVTGVVNIITANPLFDDVTGASLTAGVQGNSLDLDERLGSAVGTYRQERFGVRLSAQSQVRDAFGNTEFKSEPQEADLYTQNGRDTVNLDAAARLTSNVDTRVELSYSDVYQNELAPTSQVWPALYESFGAKGDVNVEHPFGVLTTTLYYNQFDNTYQILGDEFDATSSTTVARLQNSGKLSAPHTLRLTTEYRRTDFSSDAIDDSIIDNFAVGGMWRWQAIQSVALTSAARLDHVIVDYKGEFSDANTEVDNDDFDNLTYTEPSFNFSAVYTPTPLDTLRAGYGYGNGFPSVINLTFERTQDVTGLGEQSIFSGDPNLRTPSISSYEVGYDRRLPQLQANGSATVFFQQYDDIIAPTPFKDDLGSMSEINTATYQNLEGSQSYGLEAAWDGRAAQNIRYGANYTLLLVTDDFRDDVYAALDTNIGTFGSTAETSDTTHGGAYDDSAPVHTLNVSFGQQINRFGYDLFATFISPYEVIMPVENLGGDGNPFGIEEETELVRVPAQYILDVRAGYDVTDFATVEISGHNLLAETMDDIPQNPVDRRFYLTLRAQF